MNTAKRNPAADLLRIFAFFCVVSVHFFLHSGFYSRTVVGKRMFVLILARSFFVICVPLFMTLSGYLLRRKKPEIGYYKKIGKILVTYLLASLLCLLYSAVFGVKTFTVTDVIVKILNYTAAPYAWYIEMYLGFFLLIPFFNILYGALPSQKSKLWLILTFVILTALPPMVNIYDLSTFDPSSPVLHQLIPDSWQGLYPITYYFIGCYLSEYGLKIKKWHNLLLIFFVTLASGGFCYWRSYRTTFVSGPWCDYSSLFNMVLTTLVFALFLNTNFEKIPAGLAKFLQKISGLCLCGYLVSWVFDNELYPLLAKRLSLAPNGFVYYFVMVPLVFVLSLVTSYFLSILQGFIEKLFSVIYHTLRKIPVKTK